MKKLLVTGASGFLGWNLCSIASAEYSVIGIWNNHFIEIPGIKTRKCDITDFKQLKSLFSDEKPDAVIHTAASSNPNYCQLHPRETYITNVLASSYIAGLSADHSIPCVFTSTDLVFDGKKPPYKEDDEVSPVNTYGQQKIDAERNMKLKYDKVTICRMPLMYGDAPSTARSFIHQWIQNLKEGMPLSLFTDEIRTPVSAHDASLGLLMAMKKITGIVHLGGKERISRYNMGKILSEVINSTSAKITPCRQDDIKMSAPRPSDVSLDSTKAFLSGYMPGCMEEELKKLICTKI